MSLPPVQTATRASLLLVDDEETMRNMLTLILKRAGYQVTVAANGVEALKRVAEAIPDLILADVMMPNMDGLRLLEILRADPSTRAIPIIMLTAKGATEDVVTGLKLGADDYLTKPFELEILLARVRAKLERPPVPSEQLLHDRQTGLYSERLFADEAAREIRRAERGGSGGCLAYLAIEELDYLREQFGPRAEDEIAKRVGALLLQHQRGLDLVGRDREDYFAILLPETSPETAQRYLHGLIQEITQTVFTINKQPVSLNPNLGFTYFTKGKNFETLRDEALSALDHAALQLDLVPWRFDPRQMGLRHHAHQGFWARFRKRWSIPLQFAVMLLLGWVAPFCLYAVLDWSGHDITSLMYFIVVIALLITAILIWIEGFLALKVVNPPEIPATPYPPASAIIAAYLPNEAATIVETVQAFLRLEYPAPLQIILAYNTPTDLPVEATLREIAVRDPRFLPLRVAHSTSKAQNVNVALARVRGEFVGIFDADHHPAPRNFMRVWRWLSSGYDVVQGHCQVRNGEASWVAQMVAVEFEAIYAVSHPGRARLYDFGIFGGSNGYWKVDLLRKTRMRGFMLTEDIDSSIRITEAGYHIVSDPLLVSHELAPLTLSALWNQRMRWAQGWNQVSTRHFWQMVFSRKLNLRQKIGIVWLLGWREVYPWLSVQMFPLVVYWIIKYGGVNRLDWLIPIFVLTTLFTFSVGPGQALFAYLLAAPEVRRHKRWFWLYLLRSMFFYTEYKNVIGRLAQIKEWMGERQWKITPRDHTKTTEAEHG